MTPEEVYAKIKQDLASLDVFGARDRSLEERVRSVQLDIPADWIEFTLTIAPGKIRLC